MSQINLDYDIRSRDYIRRVLAKIKTKYPPKWLRLFVSPTGRGYHVRFFTDKDYSTEELLAIRKDLKDDPSRISMVGDEYRDVLFSAKMVDGIIYKEREIDADIMFKQGREVFING